MGLVTEAVEVRPEIVAGVRSVCLRLPDAYEEPAWVGIRWRIRMRTFAHVFKIDSGCPAEYARAADDDGAITVLMFRSSGAELAALGSLGRPFFKPLWPENMVGMILEPDVDWEEVAELLTESYCVMAPKKLAQLVYRPPG